MNPIAWAWQQSLPTAEKLVLVYLASQANLAGVGLWDREALAQATGYKPRSIQRLLKNLREAALLTDATDGWYVLSCANKAVLPVLDNLPVDMASSICEEAPSAGRAGPLFTETELAEAGDAIAHRMIDAGDYLLDQLANFESRLGRELVRFMQAADRAAERPAPPEPEPEPDPVLLDPRYQQLIEMGFSDAGAYEQVEKLLGEYAAPIPDSQGRFETDKAPAAGRVIADDGDTVTAVMYDDSPSGRLQRVRDILEPGAVLEASIVDGWEDLEADEDKHTIAGESVTGFELIYPAIVDAARRYAGTMTLEAFLDPTAIKHCRAPWDQDPTPTAQDDPVLEAEVSTMMADIEAAAHPNCQVMPRVVEKGDDGVTRIETIVGYHRRVSQVHRQLQKLKAMGAA